MSWIKKKIRNWLANEIQKQSVTSADVVANNSIRDGNEGLNFNVYKANGGFIIELRHYDRKLDRMVNNLHIIREDEDFAERIGQIVYYESLRH